MKILYTTETSSPIYSDALNIRKDVFIDEQGVSSDLEIDHYEDQCTYFLLYSDDDEAIATCRLLPLDSQTIKLQRMAVRKNFRGQDAGRLLIQAAEKYTQEQGYHKITLGAQITAVGFYKKLGYQQYGDQFLDAGIEHFNMAKKLN